MGVGEGAGVGVGAGIGEAGIEAGAGVATVKVCAGGFPEPTACVVVLRDPADGKFNEDWFGLITTELFKDAPRCVSE